MIKYLEIYDEALKYWVIEDQEPFLVSAIDTMMLNDVIEYEYDLAYREVPRGVVVEMRYGSKIISQYEFYYLADDTFEVIDRRGSS